MALREWGEEERNKAIKAFQKVHPDWHVVTGQTRCPNCHRLHYCWQHRWASRKWLGGIGVSMLSVKDPKLRDELDREGL